MTKRRRTIVLGLLGPTLDGGFGPRRWDRWRPSVAVCQAEDFVVDELILLHQVQFTSLAKTVEADVLQVSPETRVRREGVEFADPWDFEEVYGVLHDVARGLVISPDDEDWYVQITTGTHVAQICWFLLCESRRLPAKLLQVNPPSRDTGDGGGPGNIQIVDLDLSRYDRIAARFATEQKDDVTTLKKGIETRDAAFNRLIERIERVAVRSLAPILLVGPTGAGKSQLARQIHAVRRARHRLRGPLVEVNCATLRGDQAMAALFGHTKGAYTGATGAREGLLKKAHGGMLFLDEIGELGLDEQAMLLRAIEDKTFYPVGSDVEVTSDFVLVAGTNQPLRRRVEEGKFRGDLLARIDLWTFRLPGLAERRADIAPNLDHELQRLSGETARGLSMNKEARDAWLAWATSPEARWPGNFRDLVSSVTRMATLAEGGRITRDLVDEELARLRAAELDASEGPPKSDGEEILRSILGEGVDDIDRFDRVQLADVVVACREARTLAEAGRVLFAASRKKRETLNDGDRLRKYLARFDLTWERVRG